MNLEHPKLQHLPRTYTGSDALPFGGEVQVSWEWILTLAKSENITDPTKLETRIAQFAGYLRDNLDLEEASILSIWGRVAGGNYSPDLLQFVELD